MWKCKRCSEKLENEFDKCWNCGCLRDGTHPSESDYGIDDFSPEQVLPNGELLSRRVTSSDINTSRSDVAQALTRRYKDAYFSARWLIRIGSLIKWGALLIVVIGVAVSQAFGGGSFFVPAIALSIAVAIPTFILGILISGQGQTHLATLDTAVNTSRHLSKDDVVAILMG
jgi:hypothetical protein